MMRVKMLMTEKGSGVASPGPYHSRVPIRKRSKPTAGLSSSELDAPLRAFLREDLGARGDVTSLAIVPAERRATAMVRARGPGVLAGVEVVRRLVAIGAPGVRCRVLVRDGSRFRRGAAVLSLAGPLRGILRVERVMLNLLGRMSGVATATRAMVDAAAGTRARIRDTRKTTPGLRALEKAAVVSGGGMSHRAGLFDAFLAKDNHLAGVPLERLASVVQRGIARARRRAPLAFTMVEVDTEAQFVALLALPRGVVDVVLLDNMSPARMRRIVALRDRCVPWLKLEASGGVTVASVPRIARSGVDFISAGSITHSAPQVDFGLDIMEA
jgi:nicotinate-nucleotide pyrophosphorylase (carboxylating)